MIDMLMDRHHKIQAALNIRFAEIEVDKSGKKIRTISGVGRKWNKTS